VHMSIFTLKVGRAPISVECLFSPTLLSGPPPPQAQRLSNVQRQLRHGRGKGGH
jgi:hypothetical protein